MIPVYIWLAIILYCFALCAHVVGSYEIGDHFGMASRSSHADKSNVWRTAWVDMPYFLAPRFGHSEEKLFYAVLLKPAANNSSSSELVVLADQVADFRINPEVDFRISLAFDSHRFELPWITVYNAAQRRALQRLEITFYHDGYDLIKVDYQPHCKLSLFAINISTF